MPGHVLAKLKEKIKIPKETEAVIQKCSRKKACNQTQMNTGAAISREFCGIVRYYLICRA